MSSVYRMFRDGGVWSWLLLLTFVAAGVLMLILGFVLAKRPRASSGLLLIGPLAVLSMAWVGHAMAARTVTEVLASVGLARGDKARILAEGTSEALTLLVFGGVYAALICAPSALVAAIRAFRHGQSSKVGKGAILALVLGFATLIGVSVASVIAARALGGSVTANPGSFTLAALVVLACIVAAAAAGAALSGNGEPDAHAGAAGDAWTALVLGAVGIGAATAVAYVGSWTIAFGAMSGASVDPSQRERIYQEGMAEAGASYGALLLFLVPVLTATLAALMSRFSAAGSGLRRSWLSFVLGALSLALLLVLPPIRVGGAQARLAAAAEVPWPAEIQPMWADRHDNFVSVEGAVIFVGKGQVWIDSTPTTTPVATSADCTALVARAAIDGTVSIALDAATPASTLQCLVTAAHKSLGGAQKPWAGGGTEVAVPLLVRVRTSDEPNARIVTSAIATHARDPELREMAGVLHLSRAGWRYRSLALTAARSTEPTEGTGVAEIPARESGPIRITFEPDVLAETVVKVLRRQTRAVTFVLGPALSP